MKPAAPRILYLSMLPGNPGQELKLAGIRRYCSARGWRADPIGRPGFSSAMLPDILRKWRPVGCIVEGIGNHDVPPPRLFGPVPAAYIECPPEVAGRAPNILVDDAAIARKAVRELSAGRPSCYAAVGSMRTQRWSRLRLRAFREAVAAETGKRCIAFPMSPLSRPFPDEKYMNWLAAWVKTLPRNCAIFAASDLIGCRVVAAARAALRSIPRELTLLSVDNHAELCEASEPPMSSIQIDLERMGFLAARALGERIGIARSSGTEVTAATQGGGRRSCPSGPRCPGDAATVIGPLLTVRRRSTGGRGRREPWVLDAVAAIRAEACDGLSARALIARYPVSKRLFNLRFREATGHSVLDEIMHVRLEKTFMLLSQTDTAIGAIPFLCGFRSERTLETLFHDRVGMSMREWRRRNSR